MLVSFVPTIPFEKLTYLPQRRYDSGAFVRLAGLTYAAFGQLPWSGLVARTSRCANVPTCHATDSLDWFKCPLLRSCCTLHISESQLVSEEDLVTLLPSALSLFYSMQRQIQMKTRMQILMHNKKYKYKVIHIMLTPQPKKKSIKASKQCRTMTM